MVPVITAPVPSIASRPDKIFAADAGLLSDELVVLILGVHADARSPPTIAESKTHFQRERSAPKVGAEILNKFTHLVFGIFWSGVKSNRRLCRVQRLA